MRRRYAGEGTRNNDTRVTNPAGEVEAAVYSGPTIESQQKGDLKDDRRRADFYWINAVMKVMQLALSIIQVVRETNDLYHKLFPDRVDLPSRQPG